MKTKKGFTLIELLAVIVILSIIALIAVPVILNIIDKANKSAFKDTAYGIINAAELYFSQQQLNFNGMSGSVEFTFPNDIDGLGIKGNLPKQGSVEITEDGDIALAISNGRYCIIKDFEETNINIYESNEECYRTGARTVEGNSKLTLSNSNGRDLTNYIIYGNSVQGKLPNEYQQVEYIEVTSKQYIDTGYTSTGKLTVEGKVYISQPSKELAIVGTSSDGWELGFSANNNRMFSFLTGGYSSIAIIPTSSIYDKIIEFTAINDYNNSFRSLSLNVDNSYVESTSLGSTYRYRNLRLFNYRGVYWFEGKCYNIKIYDNDILVRDFIPCYRKSDEVIGMYDLVNNEFYTNAGTGNFLKGSNAPTPEAPIEVESVGEYDETTRKYKIPVKVSNDTEEYITNIYLNEPLRKIGDYADYIDFENKKLLGM